MLGPTSPLVVLLLLSSAVALLVGVVLFRAWAAKVVAGLAALVLAVSTGVVLVNDSFGYYTSWGDAYAGTFGAGTGLTTTSVDTRRDDGVPQRPGRLVSVVLAGRASHITRRGLIYLPPQYGEWRYRNVRFPVVELLSGTPGGPWNWSNQMHIAATADGLLAHRQIGPMVLVMPLISTGTPEECLNYGAVDDDTYLAKDVPADVRQHYRVSRDPAQWALFGFSSGGYCAANLALRHRYSFGAAAAMDGYFWPSDGPAGARLAGSATATLANDPLARADALPAGSAPLPQFWVSAGSGNGDDLHSAKAFVTALQRLERVTYLVQPGGRHNFYAWNDQDPAALAWLWSAIAPPDLRVAFPTSGPAQRGTVAADPLASRHRFIPRAHRPTTDTARTTRTVTQRRVGPPAEPVP